MQNPIEQLREDVERAFGHPPGSLFSEREYTALQTIDAFAERWEAVEVWANRHVYGGMRYWEAAIGMNDPTTILVLRKPKSERNELLEAAEAVEAWCRCTNHWRGMPAELHQKCDTLATAIGKERDR